jgi:hypothetical protein
MNFTGEVVLVTLPMCFALLGDATVYDPAGLNERPQLVGDLVDEESPGAFVEVL